MIRKLNATTANYKQMRPVKVLQFGEGNFLRAFVDWIIDILNEKTDFDGAVQIIQPISNGMVNALNEQDNLYHVVLKGIQQGYQHIQWIPVFLLSCLSEIPERFDPPTYYKIHLNC